MNLAGSLTSAFLALRLQPPPLQPILAAYTGADRTYHNLEHVDSCLHAVRELGETPELVVAACYHDVVYDTRAGGNEERSADWAERDLTAGGASSGVIDPIRRLILATRHKALPVAEDERILVDADLSILGQAWGAYAEYSRGVRKEYGWVDENAFREGRAKFLRGMLAREFIYSTEKYRSGLEEAARQNIRRELESLGENA